MNWKAVWMTLFHTTNWMGIDVGFWVAFTAVLLIVVAMNLVFWSMKPRQSKK